MTIERIRGTTVETTASQRTRSAFRRARNMISSAPTKGDQVMIDSSGKLLRPRGMASLSGPSHPDHQEEDAEGHAVDVVLGLAGLDASKPVPQGERPGAEHVQDSVDDVAVDPADRPRDPEEPVPVDQREEV